MQMISICLAVVCICWSANLSSEEKKYSSTVKKGLRKLAKTPGVAYLGYHAIYLGFCDLCKYG